jgi:predicted  nucleic acid-binding Zn-ribbon protein
MDELIRNLLGLQKLEFSEIQTDDAAALIAELREKIPPPILGHYDRLRVRGKKGLAAVQNQVCTGCHMRLPLAVIMRLRHGQDLQLCDNCGRYLYLTEEPASLPVETKPAAKPARAPRRRKNMTAAGQS